MSERHNAPNRIGRARIVAAGLPVLGLIGAIAFPAHSAPARPATAAEPAAAKQPLLAAPANGVLGFVVETFVPPLIQDKEACPDGVVPPIREQYLRTLPAGEQARLRLKENEKEYTRRWHAYAFNDAGANVCSQPDLFDRPPYSGVKSKLSWGLNLDDSDGAQTAPDGCSHENFQTPAGETGIDNQVYRALGCMVSLRGVDGIGGDTLTGLNQFHASGEWTQVILIKGVDSLEDDPDVEVIYANTPDRPAIDGKGHFLPGMSFTVSDKAPRHRNVLHGRIVKGVLTTDPADIMLTQTWGQGGARDIRGNRIAYDFQRGRLRLEFQPDGSAKGIVGGYQPLFNLMASPSLGGAGAALTAGYDCAATLATLRKFADGIRDPKTGQCTAISDAMQIKAVAAFVNDVPAAAKFSER